MLNLTPWILLAVGLSVHFADYLLYIKYGALMERFEAQIGGVRLIGYLGDIITILAVLKLLRII